MALNPGRGAQVRLDTEAQKIARGAGGTTLAQSIEAKHILDLQGNTADGYAPDGSTPLGGPADEEVITPGGVIGDAADFASVINRVGVLERSLSGKVDAIAAKALVQQALAELGYVSGGGVGVTPATVLPAITLSAPTASASPDLAVNTVLATFPAVPTGATRTLSPNDGRLVLNGTQTALIRGTTAANSGVIIYTITDTLAGAANSPVTATFSMTFTGAASLPAPTFAPASVSVPTDATAGTVLFDVSPVASGATRSALSPTDGRFTFNVAKTQVVVGAAALTAGSASLSFVDTLPGAPNSPRTTTLPVTITAAGAVTAARIAAVPLTGTGAPAGTVHTFGHAFARGDVKPGDKLALRMPDSSKVALQVDDVANHWDDGSLRLATLHGAMPALSNNATAAAELWREASQTTGAALNLATALAGRICSIEVKNGSNVFTFDAIAQIANFPARWFSGPQVVQARMEVDIPMAAMGGTRGRLLVDLGATSDGTLRLDYAVFNPFVFDAEGLKDAAYTVTITGEGGTKFTEVVPRAPLYTGWGHRLAWKANGSAGTFNPVWVRPDTQYMVRSGMVANQDGGQDFSEALTRWAGRITTTSWNDPYDTRDIPTAMGGTGGNNQIGEVTETQALWLATGSPIVQQAAMLQAEAGFGIPYYHIDRAHGYRYINPVDRPATRITQYPSAGYVDSSGLTSFGEKWAIDGAHFGDLGTATYVLTGRRMLLEIVQGMASQTLMQLNPGQERGEVYSFEGGPTDADTDAGRAARLNFFKTDPQARGIWVNKNIQVRATGWHFRQELDAALVLPASLQPFGELYQVIVEGNYRDWNAREAFDRNDQGEAYGYNSQYAPNFEDQSNGQHQWPDNEGYTIPPWQQNFIVAQDIRATWARIPGALQRMNFTSHFASVFFANPAKFNPADGVASRIIVKEANGTGIKTLARQIANQYNYIDNGTGGFRRTYGPNFLYLINYGVDYAQRAWSINNQLADVRTAFGLPITDQLAAIAFFQQVPEERKSKIFIRDADFRNDAANNPVRIGTTRGNAALLLPATPVGGSSGGGTTPVPVVNAPVVTAGQTFTASRSTGAGQKVLTIASTGGTPVSGTVGSPYAGVFEIRNTNELWTLMALDGQTAGNKTIPVSLTNSAGTSPVVNVTGVLTTDAGTGQVNIYSGVPDADIVEAWSFNRRTASTYSATGEIVRLQQDAETPISVNMSNGLASRAAYTAAGGSLFVGKPVWVAGQLNGKHMVTGFSQAGEIIKDQALVSSLPNFVSVRVNGSQELRASGLAINSRGLGAVGLFRLEFNSDNIQRMVVFLGNGPNDYDNEQNAALLGANNNVASLRSRGGSYQDFSGASFATNDWFGLGGGYTVDGASFLNKESTVTDGPSGYTATFPTGTMIFGGRGSGGDDAMVGEMVELVLLKNPSKANIAAIMANMRAFYGV